MIYIILLDMDSNILNDILNKVEESRHWRSTLRIVQSNGKEIDISCAALGKNHLIQSKLLISLRKVGLEAHVIDSQQPFMGLRNGMI